MITYSTNYSNLETLTEFLKLSSMNFKPPLASYIDLEQYARKIRDLAITFEVWDDGRLIGVAAVYFNDLEKRIGFFTIATILKDYQNQGIGTVLFHNVFEYGKNNNFIRVDLEVQKDNEKAIKLYERLGFVRIGDNNNNFKYSFFLNN